MNKPDSSTSAQVACAFHSITCNVRRLITWGAFSLLPAMFAANGPPPGIPPVKEPVNVQVINTEAAPVQTQDVDNPAYQPFVYGELIDFPAGLAGGNATITVPPGKRLVVEFVSFNCSLPIGQNPTLNIIQIRSSSGSGLAYAQFSFLAGLQGNLSPSQNRFVGASPTRIYVNPGSTLTIIVGRNLDTGTGGAWVAISGYYVNVP